MRTQIDGNATNQVKATTSTEEQQTLSKLPDNEADTEKNTTDNTDFMRSVIKLFIMKINKSLLNDEVDDSKVDLDSHNTTNSEETIINMNITHPIKRILHKKLDTSSTAAAENLNQKAVSFKKEHDKTKILQQTPTHVRTAEKLKTMPNKKQKDLHKENISIKEDETTISSNHNARINQKETIKEDEITITSNHNARINQKETINTNIAPYKGISHKEESTITEVTIIQTNAVGLKKQNSNTETRNYRRNKEEMNTLYQNKEISIKDDDDKNEETCIQNITKMKEVELNTNELKHCRQTLDGEKNTNILNFQKNVINQKDEKIKMILEGEQKTKLEEKYMEVKFAIFTHLEIDNSNSLIVETRNAIENPTTKYMRRYIKIVLINKIIDIIKIKRKLKLNIKCSHRIR